MSSKHRNITRHYANQCRNKAALASRLAFTLQPYFCPTKRSGQEVDFQPSIQLLPDNIFN